MIVRIKRHQQLEDIDTETLSESELQWLALELQSELQNVKAKMEKAKAAHREGDELDHKWLARANTARGHFAVAHQAVMTALNQRREQKRLQDKEAVENRRRTFERAFISVARECLSKEDFSTCYHRAKTLAQGSALDGIGQ